MFQRVKKKKIVILDVLVVSDDFDHAGQPESGAAGCHASLRGGADSGECANRHGRGPRSGHPDAG